MGQYAKISRITGLIPAERLELSAGASSLRTQLFLPSSSKLLLGLAANPAIIAEVSVTSHSEMPVYPARGTSQMLELTRTLVREKLRKPNSRWLRNAL